MKITTLDYAQIADLLEASTKLISEDQGSDRVHILEHPALNDIIVFENSSADAGFLIQRSAPGEGVHDFLRALAIRKF